MLDRTIVARRTASGKAPGPEKIGGVMRRLRFEGENPALRRVLAQADLDSEPKVFEIDCAQRHEALSRTARCGRRLLELGERIRRVS